MRWPGNAALRLIGVTAMQDFLDCDLRATLLAAAVARGTVDAIVLPLTTMSRGAVGAQMIPFCYRFRVACYRSQPY